MEIQLASTPFGSRRMSFALLAAQKNARQIPQGAAADKWQLHRWLCEAKTILGINDRSLAVLSALLSFYPEVTLTGESNLVVFPSNKQLALRAHGMADATLRRHLAALVEAGLIARQDSPNGKRYARRAKGGELQIAFGFSLAPLLARAPEFEAAAEEIKTAKAQLREMREQLTLLRRDIAKLIEFALIEGLEGPWAHLNQRFRDIVEAIPRRADVQELAMLVEQMREIRENVDKLLKTNKKAENLSGNESQNERQLNESKPDSHFDETALSHEDQCVFENSQVQKEPSISLDMVLRACPEIETYASGSIRIWQDLIETAGKVRIFLGIDNKLYDMATKTLGIHNAAITIAYILQRYDHIRSAGGYLRILSEKAASGAFSIKPLMMSAMCNRKQPARC
ncbi:replication initiation protein RepC [Brucella sp. BO2]|uniref:plasmid replication protein RepC n=1 Tax=Brucella sp. BO2 TaxID=693750 RepID=UPI00046CCDA6|nr:plasmid replication protein RepC [Brucella sp. BO2]QPN28531.1 replication initiation protein RepC [Brucella sp. BO2]